LETVSYNGLDTEVYDLRPADYTVHYYYYYYYYYYTELSASEHSELSTTSTRAID